MDKAEVLMLVVTACLIGVLAGSAVTFAVMQHSYGFSNVAAVKAVGVEVYADSALTSPLLHVDWGLVAPGESKSFTAYVRNSGNSPYTLSLSTVDWVPAVAAQAIQVSWDYFGGLVAAGQVVKVSFELQVDSAVAGIDAFSFTMVITGSG